MADRQVVLVLLDGDGRDEAAREAAASLAGRAARGGTDSPVIAWREDGPYGAEPALAKLGGASRLYLLGHISGDRSLVAGFSAEALAGRLVAGGLSEVGKISLVADAAALPGGEVSAVSDEVPEAAARSFAASLHGALARLGVRTELVARVGAVRVLDDSAGADQGRKVSRALGGADWVHKGTHDKLSWTWERDVQMVRWVERDSVA